MIDNSYDVSFFMTIDNLLGFIVVYQDNLVIRSQDLREMRHCLWMGKTKMIQYILSFFIEVASANGNSIMTSLLQQISISNSSTNGISIWALVACYKNLTHCIPLSKSISIRLIKITFTRSSGSNLL